MNDINILIPMAGNGSRFAQQGYVKPKPLIDVNGVPMIKTVVDSLSIKGNYIFIVKKEHRVRYHLDDVLDSIAPGCKIIEIDKTTDGAAITTLAAKDIINNDTPLIIANSDQCVEWDSVNFSDIVSSEDVIAIFPASDPKWSYSRFDNGAIVEVAEKRVISNDANVGIYGFKTGAHYIKYIEQMIDKNIKTNNEFYIAPVYNEIIADGHFVMPFYVDKMNGLGTPEDLEEYLAKNRT